MTAEEFDVQMCRLKRQLPFKPFVVELLDGRSIHVESPHLVVNNGGAAYWTVHPEFELMDFECEEVRAVRLVTGEVVA
jgi:hypothetical protein